MTKHYSYQGNPVSVSVKIHNQDIGTPKSIEDIGKSLDYPDLTAFRVGECSFTLTDVHGDFSPNNPSNFFTQQGGRQTGYHAPVEIEAGFIVNGVHQTQTIFKGNIIRIVQEGGAATVKVVCSDNLGALRTQSIADFGIARHFKLTEAVPQVGENGDYPIMDAVMPASHGSVTLKTDVTDTPIPPVQKLATEGSLNPRNYIITREGVKTEGGLISVSQRGYPQLRMKSPFRYRHINDVVTDILNHAGITHAEVSLPEQEVAPHFSSNGRINYDGIGTIGSSNPVTWNGYVTDFLYDATAQKWYFLYNRDRNNPNGISQILTYAVATRTYAKLHTFGAFAEVWKFIKVGSLFYVLASAGGNYDANATSCRTEILKLTQTGNMLTKSVFVPHTATLKPQLAHYYHGVGSVFMKPDSRRQIGFYNNTVYYAYVNPTTEQFGIAAADTAQTAVITIPMDGFENHAGIAFDIDSNGLLHGAVTFVTPSSSQLVVFKKQL